MIELRPSLRIIILIFLATKNGIFSFYLDTKHNMHFSLLIPSDKYLSIHIKAALTKIFYRYLSI